MVRAMKEEDYYKQLLQQLYELVGDLKATNARLAETMERLDEHVADTKKNFVSREAFMPVQRLVYGFVGVILLAAITTFTGLIFKSPSSLFNGPPSVSATSTVGEK